MSPEATKNKPSGTELVLARFLEDRQEILVMIEEAVNKETVLIPGERKKLVGFLFDSSTEGEWQCASLLLAEERTGKFYALSGKDFAVRARPDFPERDGRQRADNRGTVKHLMELRAKYRKATVRFDWPGAGKIDYRICDPKEIGMEFGDFVFGRNFAVPHTLDETYYKNALVLVDNLDDFLTFEPGNTGSIQEARNRAGRLLGALFKGTTIPKIAGGHMN